MEEPHAHLVVLKIQESPGILRGKLCDYVTEQTGASKNTTTKRINELIDAGLIHVQQSETHKAGQHLFLTGPGEEIAKLALKMQHVLAGDTIDDETNLSAPEEVRDKVKG